MKIIDTKIPDVKIIEPTVFGDERGFFMETWNKKIFEQLVTGNEINFVQDNHSKSSIGVLRGLHFQYAPYEQAKLVRCIIGEIYDVAVDIRKHSPSFGKWVSVRLSAENKKQIWIPEGFAHGFLTLSESAEVVYKTNNYYNPKSEKSIKWNDQTIGIEWPELSGVIKSISDKDNNGVSLLELGGL